MPAITVRTDRKPDVRIPVPEAQIMYVVFDEELGPIGRFCCTWRQNDNDRGGYTSYATFASCCALAENIGFDSLYYYGPVTLICNYNYTIQEDNTNMQAANYVQTTLPNCKPYFDYQTLVNLGHLHSDKPYSNLVPAFHYADCNCVECYKNHYPCADITGCDYCNAVHSLMYNYWDNHSATGLQVKAKRGHIIDYVTYQELGNVSIDTDDMIWKECRYCDILVCKYTYDDNDGYCSEECKEEDNTVYCYECYEVAVHRRGDRCRDCIVYCASEYDCDNEVEDAGDICYSCRDLLHDERGCDDGSGYLMAGVVDKRHYAGLMNCWIDTRGHVRYVPYCNHDSTATRMGYSGTCGAENAGCIHFSEYWDNYNRWRYIPSNPTPAQIDTMIALCLANTDNLKMPEILERRQAAMQQEEREVQTLTYSIFESTLPRKFREMLRPLMGD